ncbi:uncharacterized protein LOC113563228 [Ooceraea biroi]|uniref:uncharacterized protein LOC113563228 n=1 Tax=Ooceraea biroi TaxID=2015173 RepID=UPI000F08B28E|nr:uncharacterized protein LOC113563228 [Ooceraea biroi]
MDIVDSHLIGLVSSGSKMAELSRAAPSIQSFLVGYSPTLVCPARRTVDVSAYGKLGYKFADCFHKDKQSFDLFKHRSAQHVDVIILVDWNTMQETLTTSTYLNILKDIFEKCDPGTKHKKIKILNGGYQKWLMTYPTFTTNSNVAVARVQQCRERRNNLENPDAPCGPPATLT